MSLVQVVGERMAGRLELYSDYSTLNIEASWRDHETRLLRQIQAVLNLRLWGPQDQEEIIKALGLENVAFRMDRVPVELGHPRGPSSSPGHEDEQVKASGSVRGPQTQEPG